MVWHAGADAFVQERSDRFVRQDRVLVERWIEHGTCGLSAAGAEIDLLLELGGRQSTWAVEIKRSLSAKPQRGFYQAVEDIQPARAFVVHAGEDRYPIPESIEAIGLREMAGMLSEATTEGG